VLAAFEARLRLRVKAEDDASVERARALELGTLGVGLHAHLDESHLVLAVVLGEGAGPHAGGERFELWRVATERRPPPLLEAGPAPLTAELAAGVAVPHTFVPALAAGR